MRYTALLILVLLLGCTDESQINTADVVKENDTLKMQNAMLRSANKALRQSLDRMEIDLEHAVNNKRCVPTEIPKPAMRKPSKRVGLA